MFRRILSLCLFSCLLCGVVYAEEQPVPNPRRMGTYGALVIQVVPEESLLLVQLCVSSEYLRYPPVCNGQDAVIYVKNINSFYDNMVILSFGWVFQQKTYSYITVMGARKTLPVYAPYEGIITPAYTLNLTRTATFL